MQNNQYITCPIDGFTTILNTRGRLAQYMRLTHDVRGYVTQNDTPFYFHIADIVRCLIRDRNRTLQFLNTDRQMWGLNAKQLRQAMTSRLRFYFKGDKEGNQTKSQAVKALLKQLWNGQLCTESEARAILGESLWTEYLSHEYYYPLESKIFETVEPHSLEETPTTTTPPSQTLSHTHDDGTFCLTAEQYEIAKQQDLLRFMINPPKIVLQRAASH